MNKDDSIEVGRSACSVTAPNDGLGVKASPESAAGGAYRGGAFMTTRWSVVVRAGVGDTGVGHVAFSELCSAYWTPLYAYIRRLGKSPHDAEDLTQAFFMQLLQKQWIAGADQAKGRFRTFLLVALKRFLANEWDRQHALKRGGFNSMIPMDQALAESHYDEDLAHREQPDKVYEKQWAMALLERVMARLQAEYAETDRSVFFDALRGSLAKETSVPTYVEIGERLGLTEAAVKMAVSRLRARYRELLRDDIAQTVDSPADIEDEIAHLFSVFSQ
jgi:RNA polymerase sigma-70 factor (ECF subfamily)